MTNKDARKLKRAELLELLDYADAERCSASIETVERLFRQAVQQGVDRTLKAAARTAPARQQAKGALRHERIANGVEPVKSDPYEKEHACDEECPMAIEKRCLFHFLLSYFATAKC